MDINEVNFYIKVLKNTGEVAAHSKRAAEEAIKYFGGNATITDNGHGCFIVKLNGTEKEKKVK
ncbi:hypothetical protein [Metabacillus fastidiosus]|uniref:hypothetical protein n=1 Tax=Metabacillus fastidiosus TaxID=1458 RepID=UPI002E1C4F0A|nr:hypothetical protein [Metabacillus fastidiosus]